MSVFRRLRSRQPLHSGSFFVDSVDDPHPPETGRQERRASEVLIFAIALATAIGAAGLFGLLQLLLVTGN